MMRSRYLLALLVAVAVLPHAGALRNGFIFDDRAMILSNPAITGLDLQGIWTAPFWPDNPAPGLYRPVTSTSFAIDWALSGGRSWFFIAVNILLHAVATLAALCLLRAVLPSRPGIAWAAAFLFAAHPIHVEAVAWIAARSEMLAAIFFLASYRAWLEAEKRSTIAGAFLPPALWLLAMLSKESAVALPLLLLAHRLGWIEPVSERRGIRARDLGWAVSLALALFLRLWVARVPPAIAIDRVNNPLAFLDPVRRALGAGGVLGSQIPQVLTLEGYSSDYSYAEIMPGARLYIVGAAILAILLAALFLVLRRGRRTPAAWGVLFFLSLWLVIGNALVPIGSVQADRFLYLPILGLLVIAVAAFLRIPGLLSGRRVAIGFLALLVLRCGVGSALRIPEWRDDLSLFTVAVREAPRSVKARSNLAALLLREPSAESGRKALDLIEPVRLLGSDYAPLVQREAKARMFLGELERAAELYRRALDLDADSVEVLIELGNIALELGHGEEALARFEALERTRRSPDHARIGRASALHLLGRHRESADLWLRVVEVLPDSVPVRIACAVNLIAAGDTSRARSVIRVGIAWDQDPRLVEFEKSAFSGGSGD